MTELMRPAVLATARGERWAITREMKKQERRGEVRVHWEMVSEPAPGVRVIPYTRLRSRGGQRARALVLFGGAAVIVMGTVSMALAWLWEARFLILGLFGAGVLVTILLRSLNHQPACAGLHCEGCRR